MYKLLVASLRLKINKRLQSIKFYSFISSEIEIAMDVCKNKECPVQDGWGNQKYYRRAEHRYVTLIYIILLTNIGLYF